MATERKITKKGKKEELVKEFWIELSDTRKLRIEVNEFNGKHRLDIREHITTQKYTGFTSKGVNISTNQAKDLRDALVNLVKVIDAENLINKEE